SSAMASAATPRSATTRPSTSHASVERPVSGRNGSAAKAAARAVVRATAHQPIRPRPPKQPHGAPARPRAIATTCPEAKTASSAAAASAASTSTSTATANATSAAMASAQAPARTRASSSPYERSASLALRPARALAAAATSSTPARTIWRRPTTVKRGVRIRAAGDGGLGHLERVQEVGLDRLLLSLHLERRQALEDGSGRQGRRRLGSHDDAGGRRRGLQPRREVDGVAHDAVLAVAARPAHDAGQDFAAVHPGAETGPVRVRLRHLGGRRLEGERGAGRASRVVVLVAV